MCCSLSGHQDSNLGPPAPKAGALTGLRHAPIHSIKNGFIIKLAEEAGFEPAVPVSKYVDLANRWIQPLSHSSE